MGSKNKNFYSVMSPYKKMAYSLIKGCGGWFNAHAHLDRANTLDPKYWVHAGIDPLEAATYPLYLKQNLTGELHKGLAYSENDLIKRMSDQIEQMVACKTRRVDTLIDATPDIGLIAVNSALRLKEKYKEKIDIRVGTQPIFGFKNPKENPDRWDIFREASIRADFIGGLPEKDASQSRIGFDEHLKMIIELGIELGKEVHVHVDQGNDPRENGTETLIEAVRWLGLPAIPGSDSPTVWAVHVISPSCYGDARYALLLDNLKKYDIGVICCPRAALTMRQLRPFHAPIHNSITRLLEMVKHEIPIRIGTDNVADIFIPTGDGNMLEEINVLADCMRYFNTKLWAKLGCGEPLNDMDRELVSRALYQDRVIFRQIDEQ